jgi:hypothetical protein
LALPTLLYGCETWAIRVQDKSRITSAEMKFMRRRAKINIARLQNYEDILSELKINPAAKKIQNYRNKWIQHVRRMDRDRQTTCHT